MIFVGWVGVVVIWSSYRTFPMVNKNVEILSPHEIFTGTSSCFETFPSAKYILTEPPKIHGPSALLKVFLKTSFRV